MDLAGWGVQEGSGAFCCGCYAAGEASKYQRKVGSDCIWQHGLSLKGGLSLDAGIVD